MGTTSDKLTYLNGTKSAIKDSINLGGGTLTTEPFREYASAIKDRYLDFMNNGIDVIWNNWEKVLGEGTSLTLSNTVEAPMKIEYVGNTSQETTTGKNLFNDYRTTSDTARGVTVSEDSNGVKINGTYDQTSNVNLWLSESTSTSYNNLVLLKANTKYTIKVNLASGTISNTNYYCYVSSRTADENKTFSYNYQTISYSNGSWSKTFTVGDSDIYLSAVRLTIPTTESATFTNAIMHIQVEQGNTATAYEPYTNGPSPNPTYPQPIHVVSGDNEVEVSNGDNTQSASYPVNLPIGNNIFTSSSYSRADNDVSVQTVNENEVKITYNGTSLNYRRAYFVITNLKANTDYTFSAKIQNSNSSANNWLVIRDDNYTTNLYNNSFASGGVVTVNTGQYTGLTLALYATGSASITNNTATWSEIELVEGNYTSETIPTFEPYGTTPIELCSIGDYKDTFFKTSGKNLLSVHFTQLNTNNLYCEIPNFKAGTYTLSFEKTDINGSQVTARKIVSGTTTEITHVFNSKTLTFTLDVDATLRLEIYKTNILVSEVSNAMLNEGTTALPYEPYGTNEWYLEKKIGKVVLNGSESWNEGNKKHDNYSFYFENSSVAFNDSNEIKTISNYFIGKTPNEIIADGITGISTRRGNGQGLYIRMYSATNLTLAQFKTWLSTHNTTVYYVLATPTYTKIEGTLKGQLEAIKKSKNGQTNISQTNNDLPFILDVSALKE